MLKQAIHTTSAANGANGANGAKGTEYHEIPPANELPSAQALKDTVSTILSLDRTMHEPSRMAILNVLIIQGPTDNRELSLTTGLSRANLSNHLSKLRRTGLVCSEETPNGMRLDITQKGKDGLHRYYAALQRIIAEAEPVSRSPDHNPKNSHAKHSQHAER